MAKKNGKTTRRRETQGQRITRLENDLADLRANMRATAGGALLITTDDTEATNPKSEAISSLEKSIGLLKEEFNLLDNQRSAPSTTLTRERLILQEMGNVQAEIMSQELLLLHSKRMSTTVEPPNENAGKDLANALTTLEQMRLATDRFVLFMDLAASIVVNAANHRREIDSRASD